MLDLKKLAGLTAAALIASAVSASAAVVIQSFNYTMLTPNAVEEQPTSSTPVYEGNTSGNDGNQRTPYESAPNVFDLAATFNNVAGTGTATYDYGAAGRNSFSLMWGSPDAYNVLTFFDGATQVGQFIGAANGLYPGATIIPLSNLGTTASGFVNLVFSGFFTKVVFDNNPGTNSFEFAQVNTVPLPAAGLLLFGALGGLGLMSRRRKAA
jgi:hypothetical protein